MPSGELMDSQDKQLKSVEERLCKESHLIAERIKKLNELKDQGINPYPYSYTKSHYAKELNEKFSILNPEQQSEEYISIAGRIISLRRLGKVTFMHIADSTGKIQAYFSEQELADYRILKLLDMGDYIGVKGKIFKTKTGEVSVKVQELEILSKSLRPLP